MADRFRRRVWVWFWLMSLLLVGCSPPTLRLPGMLHAPATAPGVSAESAPAAPVPGLLQVHFIDVGQGDSILIQAPDGATALIDGGYQQANVLAYLQRQGITRIDTMIATHPHADHIGGLIDVLHTLPVGVVVTSGASHSTGTFERFLDAIIAAKVPYREVQTGEHIAVGTLQLQVLRSDAQARNLNDTALVLRLAYGQISLLLMGDAEAPSERALLASVPEQLPATIIKVGHHGSRTSSSPAFLAAVRPQIAVYSAGRHNSYGHPHAQTIAALEAVGARIYGTDRDGTIILTTDGVSLQITTPGGTQPDVRTAPAPTAAIPTPEPPTPAAAPTSTPPGGLRYDPFGPDRDCGDFATHEEAQAFFVAAGGPGRDPHRLDGDGDSIACESLPRSALPTPAIRSNPTSGIMRYNPFGPDRDCGNFATHAEAQAFFVAAGGPGRDPHRLDGDGDGVACESLP